MYLSINNINRMCTNVPCASVPFSGPSSLCQQSWCLIGKIIALKAVNGHMCNERDDMIWLHLNLCVAIYLSSHLQIYIYIKYDSIVLLVQSDSNSSTILIMSYPNNHLKYIITLRRASRSSHLRNTSRYTLPLSATRIPATRRYSAGRWTWSLLALVEPAMDGWTNDGIFGQRLIRLLWLKTSQQSYPLVMTDIAVEHGHRNSEFSD